MIEIPLTRGYVALIDDGDVAYVSGYAWYAHRRAGEDRPAYACTKVVGPDGKRHGLYMHRLLLPNATTVDHRNGNGLDNRRENLRVATPGLNVANRPKPKTGLSSRFKGVGEARSRWRAWIKRNGKRHHLGVFATEEDAARAYNIAATELFGEFARLNYLPPGAAPEPIKPRITRRTDPSTLRWRDRVKA